MSVLVESLGLPVQVAHDGVQALERISERIPGFVILDLMMPGMDGFSVLGRMKLDADKRDIPVLVLTGAKVEEAGNLEGLTVGVIRKGNMDIELIKQLIKDALAGNGD